jgi:SAM-dependent methyltransferase
VNSASNPFTDPDLISGPLYASAGRLARRTAALHRARVSGQHAGEVIADLAAGTEPITRPLLIADLGCGRGTSTRMLAARLPAATIVAVDLSAAMLASVREQLATSSRGMLVRADFHRLPFSSGACDLIVVAFCLYHSARPESVVAEITRCLRPGGTAIFAVKSRDSYRELDELMADAGLDPGVMLRPSLYQTAHSGNITTLVSGSLSVQRLIDHTHCFTFPTFAEAAGYLVTSPKYRLPAQVRDDPVILAAALRQRVADRPVTTTSVVTYLAATSPAAPALAR